MNYKEIRSFTNDRKQGRIYETDDSFTVDRIIELLKIYESDTIKMFACYCSTFTEEGLSWNPELQSIEELSKMKSFPNPSIQIRAVFINRNTEEYAYDVTTSVNTNVFTYQIDSKMKEYIRKQVEIRKMIEDKKKENQVNKQESNSK